MNKKKANTDTKTESLSKLNIQKMMKLLFKKKELFNSLL